MPAGSRHKLNGSRQPSGGRPRSLASDDLSFSLIPSAFSLDSEVSSTRGPDDWSNQGTMAATRVRVFLASAIAATVLVTWPTAAPVASDQRSILHVLNRLGYGPTAAAVDQVKRAGVQSYIDAQLRPERLPDTAMAARLSGFTTLSKSSRDLAAEYFMPAMLERRDAQRRAGQTGAPDSPAGDRAGCCAHARADRGDAHAAQRHRRAVAAADPSCDLQRASARRAPRRLLDESLQRVRGQGPGPELPDRVRARRHPPAGARQVPRSAGCDGSEPGDALLSRQLAERRARRSPPPRRMPNATGIPCPGACPGPGLPDRRRRLQDPGYARAGRCPATRRCRRSSAAGASTRTTRAS